MSDKGQDHFFIELRNVCKIYESLNGQVVVLSDVSLRFQRGEFVVIMGPSGSGKSTLLHIMGCLDLPTSGVYTFESVPIHTLTSDGLVAIRNQKIGFVFQSFHLLPRLTAVENVALPLLYAGSSVKVQREKAFYMLEKVGLSKRALHTPNQLSGGEQQRVALARALVNSPSLILADEPTGSLDSKTSQEIINLLLYFHQEVGVTILLVTHDSKVARNSQRVLMLHDGQVQG